VKPRFALAVRPYGERLRPKVFGFLDHVGLSASAPPELGPAASIAEIVRYLTAHRADLLVVPFHVLRTADGERTDGLKLLAELRARVRWTAEVLAVMPVSLFARVAFDAAWRSTPLPGVFPLFESEVEGVATRTAFLRFLEASRKDLLWTPSERGTGRSTGR
jgi:hypothetical protein